MCLTDHSAFCFAKYVVVEVHDVFKASFSFLFFLGGGGR